MIFNPSDYFLFDYYYINSNNIYEYIIFTVNIIY